MTYTLKIYGLESVQEFNDKEEAEGELEYLERVQNKICRIEENQDE